MRKRYEYRIYPDGTQRHALARLFGCVRFIHNWAVGRRRDMYRRGGVYITDRQMNDDLILLKNDPSYLWLKDVSSVPLIQEIRIINKAYTDYFKSLKGLRQGPKLGVPRFKAKRGRQAAQFTTKARFHVWHDPNRRDGWLRLPKIGNVRVRWTRDLPSEPTSVTVYLEPDGTYHASFVVTAPDTHVERAVPKPDALMCGIDLGLNDIVTLVDTNGNRWKTGNPRFLREAHHRIGRLQHELARKTKGSNRYEQARVRLAKAQAHLRRIRLAWLDVLAEKITDENQAVALESLNIRGLAKSRVGKSVLDAGWGILLRLIHEKAERKNRTVIHIGRWEPTSQVCSHCGKRTGKKPLDVRTWECPYCRTPLDRDYNAAVNILQVAAGPAETLNGRGGEVRQTINDPRVGSAALSRETTTLSPRSFI
ncbi:RNA-guided endonuclease TnpB family protein [Bifidobacterium sp. SO1]|uniref:RNA-guided endonuclease InsQ/TnpB family protein n=1 Tax=Bifidobacterium sp. SO1 TaxID=2809029 RepID=UPI001BDC5568|nr:RNA-guided endonuclease TnpB family protein [Bifidobacterium sp. SO1]MBT1162876.1 transposase [Bifidobacterium sp. SO1]